MIPHSNRNQPTEPIPGSPLDSFVQLVMPQQLPNLPGCGVTDTLSPSSADLVEIQAPPRCAVDSPDDLLAEFFPDIRLGQATVLRNAIEEFVSSIRDEVSMDRRTQIRFGASRHSLEYGPIVWIECLCLDTECYVLPKLREGVCGAGWNRTDEQELPERFFNGSARLMLQFDVKEGEILRCVPLVSPLCSGEAEEHLIIALRQGELAEASYLLSQYHDLVVAQAIRCGDLSVDASQMERAEYLAERWYPERIVTSYATDGTRAFSLHYGEQQGRRPYIDVISLVEVSPWGLKVSGLTTLQG
jgi:hypothetical protein